MNPSLKIVEVKQHDPSPAHITWIINNICPNACSYCPEQLHTGSNHNYDWNNARKFVELLLEKYKIIHLSIAGGEPSMSPFLPELVKMFHDRRHTVSLTTNGYKSPDYWREISECITDISFSYHPEFATEQYFDNLNAASKITKCGAKVMMLASHWDKCIEVLERLKQSNLYNIAPTRILKWGQNNSSADYNQEQLQWFTDNPPRNRLVSKIPLFADFYYDNGTVEKFGDTTHAINQGLTNFKGYSCDVGLNSLFIGFSGFIKRGNCMAEGWIGDINQPDKIEWPTNPIICPYTLCSCSSDVMINKKIIY